MKLLVVLVLVLSTHFSYGQDFYDIDSLKLSLAKSHDNVSKVLTLAALSFSYALAQPDTGILYGQQAIALAKKTGDKKGEAWQCFRIAGLCGRSEIMIKRLTLR